MRTSVWSPGGDADEQTLLGGEQNPAFPEPADDRAFDTPWYRVAFCVGGRPLRDGHGMGVGELQAEAFGPLGKAAQVAAPVEEVIDELTPRCLLLPHRKPLCSFVPLTESFDSLLNRAEHVVRSTGQTRPGGSYLRDVLNDRGAQGRTAMRLPSSPNSRSGSSSVRVSRRPVIEEDASSAA